LRGAFFATKQSHSATEIASQSALAMTDRLSSHQNKMLFSPIFHGSYLDEWLFGAAVIVTLILFMAMAFADRKKSDDERK